MGKHAYLIMCHNNLEILKKLVSCLDDERNDIYVHVDRKVKTFSHIKKELSTRYASLTFTKRVSVSWGGFSQIKAELLLLEEASREKHDYYHLLSGVDMPLLKQDAIHDFFIENYGKEFIDFDPALNDESLEQRVRFYRFFQDIIGRRTDPVAKVLRKLEELSLGVQKRLGLDRRIRHPHKAYKGSQWFSITHNMAKYILKRKNEITAAYRFSLGVDELFLHTFAMESPYARNIASGVLRCIDWERGSPYTFLSSDFDELINSGKMFARKFDVKTDFSIVERIYTNLQNVRDE